VCELVRGKTGRVVGHLMALLTLLKGLPMTYNKDMQEDKEGLFDTVDTLKFSLSVYASMLKGMKINGARMRQVLDDDFSNATDMADYLVRKGLPFREAHAVVGKAVRLAIETDRVLTDVSLDELQNLCSLFESDILDALRIETCIEARKSEGGTASAQVTHALTNCRAIMLLQQAKIDMYTIRNI
jgi:argininosuccinate lyase